MYICNMGPINRIKLSFLDKGIRETFTAEDGRIFHTNFTRYIKKDNFDVYEDERTIEDLTTEDEITLQIEKSCPFYDVDTYV